LAEYIITKYGINIYKDYLKNICCPDLVNPALTIKANSPRERINVGNAKGLSRFGSVSSEDSLTWSVFRTLEVENQIDIILKMMGIMDKMKSSIYWLRNSENGEINKDLKNILDEFEPIKYWKQQTEPDYVLIGIHNVIFIESKLEYPHKRILGWSRKTPLTSNHKQYIPYVTKFFNQDFINDYTNLGQRFFQLMRNVIVGSLFAESLRKTFHLGVVINELNQPNDADSHIEKFNEFNKYIFFPKRTHLLTWQRLLSGIELIQTNSPNITSLIKYMYQHPCLNH